MFLSSVLLALLLQSAMAVPPESTPDLRQIVNSGSFNSVEVIYRDQEKKQVIVLRGDGTLIAQSARVSGSPALTCKGKIAPEDFKQLLAIMLEERFTELPRKSYLVVNGDERDWQKLRIHSIDVRNGTATARRDFAAGEYHGAQQDVPMQFVNVEKAILSIEQKAIPDGTRCTLGPPAS